MLAGGGGDPALIARLLDQLEIGFCRYGPDDRVVHWNETYLAFFPEQAGRIGVGTSYAETLVHFFRSNLPESELPWLERHVAAGVARHRTQQVPFVFQRKNGRWLKVASLPAPDGGRIRLWRDVSAEQAGGGQTTTARALAALDVGYAVFDGARRFVTANKRYQELFPEIGDLIGTGVAYQEHLERIASAVLAPADGEALRARAGRLTPEERPVSLPLLLRRRNGGWLQLEERHGEDGTLVSLWMDATRQVEAEARIVRLERYLQDAVEAIPHGLLLFDQDEQLALANRRLVEIDAGLARVMSEGAPLQRYAEWRAALADGPSAREELLRLRELSANEEVLLADGRWLAVEAFRTSNRDLLLLLTDVTREKAAEAELQRQRDAMHQNEKLAALGSLLAGVAHELNNPLSIVVGRASLLQSSTDDPAVVAQARTIGAAANRCARIVKTFLELARQRPPARRAVSLNGVVADSLALVGYGLKAAGVTVETEFAPDLPDLWADPDQLSQVLINLIINAQHALTSRPEPRRLRVATRYDAARGTVEVRISDNGPGIPAEIRSRIFEPFFTTKPMGEGTGLGLSMSLGRVQSHGGTMAVEESAGGGATFVVTLPLTPPAGAAAEPAAPAPPAAARRRILVVDDEREIAELLGDLLAADGHDVALAASGREALDRLERERFDLVISDLMMPGLDGAALWHEAARRRQGVPLPFVFLTGDTLRMGAARLPDPACAVIEKPFDPAEVRRLVRAQLARATGG
ncbi:MAG TPA: PAS-domain containing protein [Geminicoccaceae bacterium]|nr:PAS-domain containing protein [Geminicoccaceae bacterium]